MSNSTSASTKGNTPEQFAFGGPSTVVPRQYEPFVPGPNSRLSDFIAAHSTPYDPMKDIYDVPAFDRDCSVDNAAQPKAIFDLHFYKGKKHWTAIRQYIRHYLPEEHYRPGTGLVLDCFSGSGMTGVAAMMEARPCVLIDASPAAAFISHCYTHPIDPEQLEAAYQHMMTATYPAELRAKLRGITGREIRSLIEELEWLFETRCDRCGGDATTEYVVYSERFQCPACAEVVALYDCAEAKVPYSVGGKKAQKTELKKRLVCPHCLARRREPHRDFVISTRSQKFGVVPVLVRYRCLGRCKPAVDQRRHDEAARTKKARFFKEHDLAKLDLLEQVEVPHWYPKRKMMDIEDDSKPWGVKWRAGTSSFRTVADLYTKRNLWALAAILRAISEDIARQPLALAVTASSLIVSRMCRESNTQILNGTYYLPQISKAIRPDRSIGRKKDTLVEVYAQLPRSDVLASCGDARALPIQDGAVDYIFTDPPYVDKVQYGELNFVWDSWLRFDGSWLDSEIVVNPVRGKSVSDWDRDLRIAFGECYRVLKPGRWMSVCFHDTDPATWTLLQNALLDVGFELSAVGTIDPEQKSQNQYTAEKVAKADLVLNCRKPRPGERGENGNHEITLVSQRVRDILVETLSQTGGQTRDRLWNLVLKRLLSRGQMAEHRFDDILSEIASRSESGRWFVKEEFESLSENDLRNEEKAGEALGRFSRLRMVGAPASFAAEIAIRVPQLADSPIEEKQVEKYIRDTFIKDKKDAAKFELGGRLKGVEFYDCLFFYLTRWLKERAGGKTPRRDLAEFLSEYLVRFNDGDKWLYRPPNEVEARTLRKARQTGLGRRIRQYIAFLQGEGEFPKERMPDAKTLVAWLKHCAAFGLAEDGVALFEKGGLVGQLGQLAEDERYDAQDYYAQCRRRARPGASEDEDDVAEENPEEE